MRLPGKILDKYIIKKFIGTYLVSLILIIGIVIIFDISEKIDKFVEKEAPLRAIIFDYYANFIPYILNTFSPIFVFITVIFITSKLAGNSEIIAMLSGGMSFGRLMRPYMLSALLIAIFTFILGIYIIPPANKERLDFEQQYVKGTNYYNSSKNIHYQLSPGNFVYVESFSSWNNTAYKFTLEDIENNRITKKLTAEVAAWDTTFNGWELKNCVIREYIGASEKVSFKKQIDTVISLTLDDFYRRRNVVESLPQKDLDELIAMQKMRGDDMVKYALIEKNSRLAMPFSAFILTIIGVALSSKKRRGGIGLNIGIGIALSFTYILFMKFSEMFVHTGALPPEIALWMPNILFAIVAAVLYRMAPK